MSPEIGNLLFGNSRGAWPVPRDSRYEAPLYHLRQHMDDVLPDGWEYGDGFSNDVFEMRAYYWGECSCGYAERQEAWEDDHDHTPECYRYRVHRDLLARGFVQATWTDGPYTDRPDGMSYDTERAVVDEVREKWCRHFDLPFPHGCAVHCTCEYDAAWEAFVASDGHDPACPIVLPNFLHKPSGLRLDWYKYPLRDSYMSREVTPREWRTIIRECFDSLSPDSAVPNQTTPSRQGDET